MFKQSPTTILLLLVVLALLTTETYAFGAGEIPEFAYLHDKAFRHGDIENILEELAKTVGGAAGGASLFGFAQALLTSGSGGGSKFAHADVKRVYFGNWLRDYSQAMDIAGLSKLSGDTLVLIVSILGFVTFGFATEEYEVTKDRLGVYLPVEHIDNPKGYAEAEGDARQYDRRLRPPVNPEELEIDTRTGMKNYMATENRGWDTSTAHVRRVFRQCIDYGRRAQGREGADLFEAYRLLGTGLHTMEDLLAHSNWCELALRKMGHEQVFPYVGDNVVINTPNGRAPPLITGTFGSADFLHSLMGEATDHLSQASVVDLSKNLANAQENDTDSSVIRDILKKLPIGGSDDDKVDQADAMKAKAQAYNFNPDEVLPPEVQQQMFQLLKWRDDIYRDILKKIEMVPGLETLINTFTDALNAFVYTILAPYLTPILKQVTDVLSEGSKALLDSHADQYEVFDNPHASDPSHSLLSKDHFALILNEPAGKIAQLVVKYAVGLIVNSWFEEREDPDRVIDQILEAFHHPYYNTGRSRIQQDMFDEMERWFRSLDQDAAEQTLQALTKESVRDGRNKRQDSDSDMSSSGQIYGQTHSQSQQGGRSSYGGGSQGGYGGAQGGYRGVQSQRQDDSYRTESTGYGQSNYNNEYGGGRQTTSAYGREDNDSYSSSKPQRSTYGEEESSYSRQTRTEDSYGSYAGGGYSSGRRDEDNQASNRYGQSTYSEEQPREHHGRRHQEDNDASSGYERSGYQPSYSSTDDSQRESYGRSSGGYGGYERRTQQESDSFGRSSYAPSYERQERRTGGYRESESYGGGGGYGSSRRDEYGSRDEEPSSRYGRPQEESYGSRRNEDDEGEGRHGHRHHNPESQEYGESGGYGGGYGGNESSGYGGGGYGRDESSGYGRNEDRGYGGGGDETFGAERLNIRDEGEEEYPRHGHHKHRQQEEW
ncbi:heterokaryon incompatibility protein Het-C-domain-containing protein [Irpex rosettiformis]|uniref:Heterokaryon incompatibility protein Het-C-domain-containing protein n=1 Tax=Irpex rosettiformis TaxID=378272 RepID=A0ACB8UJ97_9APHY|nr:heterokaryon incompatibility protein Het-C-domain-containing protein [Irpex rosettiformis]